MYGHKVTHSILIKVVLSSVLLWLCPSLITNVFMCARSFEQAFAFYGQAFFFFPLFISAFICINYFLKSLLQHYSSKASILRHSAFFTVQLSHPYITTRKTIALTWWTFVGKVMSLLLNMLPRLVITFLPRGKHLLISWLQSPTEVILEPKKIKSDTVSTVSLSVCHEVMGLDAMVFIFWMWSFKPTFSLSSFTFIKRLFSSSSLLP